MLECFNRNYVGVNPYTSSTGHRNAQRANAVSEVVASSLAEFTPALIIPTKLAQSLTSTYSFFRADTHAPEKAVHLMQALLAAAQLFLAATLLYTSSTCTETKTTLCQSIFLSQLLYRGVLLVGWVPSEFAKDPYEPIPPPGGLEV